MNFALTLKSNNSKTGPIPVSVTSSDSCPTACPLAAGGCYAKGGPLAMYWRKVSAGTAGAGWKAFLASVRALPAGQLWRHNQAGDLPGEGNRIDAQALRELVRANEGKKGFTYTHKPPTKRNARAIAEANENGFVINLSANSMKHADELAGHAIGPVVTVLPITTIKNTRTPAGRSVIVCPATYRENISCSTCGLCARATRGFIVGFPAHGASKRKASNIAEGIA